MKKILLFLFTSILLLHVNGQSIPDSVLKERLFYTCKVWGLVKYFHPNVAHCTQDWDNSLINTYQQLIADSTDEAFNATLLGMISNLGLPGIPTSSPSYVADSLKFNLDTTWIGSSILSDTLKSVLDTIMYRFRPQFHCLVQKAFQDGNLTFNNEDPYTSLGDYPGEEYRFLAVCRYWNIINYFFPYK